MTKSKGKNPFPVMEHMTVKMVEEYLMKRQSIIIPIGVIEQHGYHLPLNTDALIATHLGKMIGEETDILVAPTMYESFSGGGCKGTINISPATMSLVISDRLISLAVQGFRNFYLFLCHGGSENALALDNAVKMLLRGNPMFENVMIALLPVWKFDSEKIGWSKAIAEGDYHAGWLETSIVMALEPENVHMNELKTDSKEMMRAMSEHPDNYQHAQKIVDDELVIPRLSQRSEVKIGVMGYPERASVEIGKRVIKDIVETAAVKINYLEERSDGVYKEVTFQPEPLILE
ncbi:MAG: creatininase family protein [Spirochaetales bacterium]|nr:creatininase family protein [Spirochaetales bacterium]